jgi:hypothetical protein
MTMPTRARAVAAIALLAAASPALGGAWTMPRGGGQVTLSATVSQAVEAYDGAGRRQETPRYRKAEAQALFEFGLTDDLTLMLGPGFQHVDIAPPTDASRTGFGYNEFGARYRFLHGTDWVLSGQALVRAPGTFDTANPAAIGYTGMEYDLRLLFGKSLSLAGRPAFIDLQVAQRFRAGAPPDELRIDGTVGVTVAPRWMLLAQSFNVISEGSGSAPFTSYHYSKLQLSAVYEVAKDWSVQFGGFVTVAGRNALQENGLVAGLQYRF